MDERIPCPGSFVFDRVDGATLLCLVDGEHYPPVTRWTLQELEQAGGHIVALVFIGGTEKVGNAVEELQDERRRYTIYTSSDTFDGTLAVIEKALEEHQPDIVVDLSDEPVIGYHERFRIATRVLLHDACYAGADFWFTPPERRKMLSKPSLAVIGTGKRVGKTAVSVSIARLLDAAGYTPMVVAMGRGGPPEPEVIRPRELDITLDFLIDIAEGGGHAASDYWEDAILADVPTVGCRRCGGGMAGDPVLSNVLAGAMRANEMPERFVIMEGSGPTLPPVATDASVVVVGAMQPLRYITGFFGEYRLRRADLAVVTMCEEPMATEEQVQQVYEGIREVRPDIDVALTVFRPEPHGAIEGRRVMLATTANPAMQDTLCSYLEQAYGCQVVGVSTSLSDRARLRRDLEHLDAADVLLTEIKAASIDVAAAAARERGCDVVFMHNQPVVVGGTVDSLDTAVLALCNNICINEEIP
ncbi:MAG: cyclic 2,3-diphosphoglycerate synthetase [Thermoplasmatota archaeon]